MTNWLYKILHTIVLWIGPVLIVITSFTLILPQNGLIKSVIEYDDFYARVAQELQSPTTENTVSLQEVIIKTLLNDVATKEWIKNLTEQNIDAFILWITGQTEDWKIFLPVEDIQESLSKNVDNEVKELISQNSESIPTCTGEESLLIQENGFSPNQTFCLPPSVKTGDQTLTQYLGLNDDSLQEGFFESFVNDSEFTETRQNVNAEEVLGGEDENQQRISNLTILRSGYLFIQDRLISAWVIFGALILGCLLLAKSAGKTFVGETKRLSLFLGINSIALSLSLILFLGGFNYLTSLTAEFILPGVFSGVLSGLVMQKFVLVVATLLSVSIATGILLVFLRIVIGVAQSLNIFGGTEAKNKKLALTSTDLRKNPTLDGEFKRELEKKSMSTQPPVQLPPLRTEYHNPIDSDILYSSPIESDINNPNPTFTSPEVQNLSYPENVDLTSYPDTYDTSLYQYQPTFNEEPSGTLSTNSSINNHSYSIPLDDYEGFQSNNHNINDSGVYNYSSSHGEINSSRTSYNAQNVGSNNEQILNPHENQDSQNTRTPRIIDTGSPKPNKLRGL